MAGRHFVCHSSGEFILPLKMKPHKQKGEHIGSPLHDLF